MEDPKHPTSTPPHDNDAATRAWWGSDFKQQAAAPEPPPPLPPPLWKWRRIRGLGLLGVAFGPIPIGLVCFVLLVLGRIYC